MTGKVVNFLRKEKHRGENGSFSTPTDAQNGVPPMKAAECGMIFFRCVTKPGSFLQNYLERKGRCNRWVLESQYVSCFIFMIHEELEKYQGRVHSLKLTVRT